MNGSGVRMMTDEVKGRNQGKTEDKVGVYICHCGGNISDHVDVETVRQRVEKIPGVFVARSNEFMCSDPGQDMIAEDLKNGTINRVVVASCAPSLHEMTFRGAISRAGANPYIYEHANIREQVSWVHDGQSATDKATHLVAAAVGKARNLKPLEPIRVEAKKHATIIGGGVGGLKAAKDLSDRGIEVVLIEKSPFLGGRTAQLDRLAPTGEKASDVVSKLAGAVLDDPAITVYICARVVAFDGYVGNFNVTVKATSSLSEEDQKRLESMKATGKPAGEYVPFLGVCPFEPPEKEEEVNIETGVVVLATGFKPYQPRTGEYGFGEHKEVITLPEFIRIPAENRREGKALEINGRKIRSIAMIHCVGSRHIPGNLNEYCSRTCCTATINAANTIRQTCPETRVYEFYRDIRTYGRGQEELYNDASDNGVVFLRFMPEEPPVVSGNGTAEGYPLTVKVKDTLTFGEEVEVPADLVVLAVGMEPAPIPDLVDMMKLPVGADRFLLEVHPKLRPVELSVAGVMLAGTCQAPMDVGETCNAAGAAAVKTSAMLAKGFVELDPFVAEVDLQKCKGHGACVEACLAEGALSLVNMMVAGENVQRAQVFSALCLGCGACVAVCPENAIDIKGWTLQEYEDMVDMIVADDLAAQVSR
jgi:heterodisulfide reductase subunit A